LKKYLQKSLKIFLWTIGSIFALLLLILILIQIPAVQNIAKEKVVAYLQEKIKTKVSVDTLQIGFPKKIILKGVYFEGQKRDTLLAGKELSVDISMFQLMNNKVEINAIDLQGITANVSRDSNAVYNFDYIIKAFATADQPKKDSTPMEFSLEKINLDNLKINYNDAYSKNDLYFNLSHLDTRIKSFDLNKMDFNIPKITIKGLTLRLEQGILKEINKATEEVKKVASDDDFSLELGEIDLSKIDIQYRDEKSKLATTLAFKKLGVKFSKTDINNQFFLIDAINLTNAKGKLTLEKVLAVKDTQQTTTVAANQNKWEFKIKESTFKNVDFDFDDNNAAAVRKGIDYKHLKIKALSFDANNIHYSPLSIAGEVNSFTVKEQSGLNIQSFKTDFFYGRKNSYLKNLYLKTPQTLLKDAIEVGYPSIESISSNLGELSINADLKNSRLGFKDILIFVPTLANSKPFNTNPEAILLINSKVTGKLKQIEIPKLEISGIGTTKIAASGTITGLPDVNKAYFDLDIKEFRSSAKDLNEFVPKSTIPNNIQLPSQFNIKGKFKGTINYFNTNLILGSSYGGAKINAMFDQRVKNKEKYDAQTELQNFDLGKLLRDKTIGKLSVNATAKGTGLDTKTANAKIKGTIFKLDYNKYTYQNLNLNGAIANGLFNVAADMNNPDLTFDLVSSGSFKDKYPQAKANLNIDIADLEKLNLHAGPLKIRGNMAADIQSANLDYLNGKLHIVNLTIADAKEQFVTDSISIIATSTKDTNAVVLKSPFINASIKGQYKLTKIANALQHSLAQYYNTTATVAKPVTEKQKFEFKIGVTDSPILLKLIPEIKSLEPIAISGRYNSVNDSIVIKGTIPKLVYGQNTITNAVLKVDTKDKALLYSFIVDDIQNNQFQLPYTAVTGQLKDNTANYTVQLKDLKDVERYLLAGTLQAKSGDNELHLDPSKLVLNYEDWKIDPNNAIRFGSKGIYANQFDLSKDGSHLKLQSTADKKNAPLAVDFKDFKIETISSIVEKSDLQISGNINGKALVKNLTTSPEFTSDLLVDNFAFKKDTVGNIEIHIDNQVANTYSTKVAITGQGNQMDLNGTYTTGAGVLNMNLDIAKLNLKSIQGFTFGNLTESTGFLNGQFTITGKANQPDAIGNLKFNDVGFKVTPLNATFKSIDDSIKFTAGAISLDHFTIKDEKDNDLVINGTIDSKDFMNLGFNLTVDADNFKAVNSQAKDNDLYYGEMYLDNHLRIKGDFNNPVIDGNIKVNKDTKFTIVLPQSDPSIADREGIVEFIDQDNPSLIKTVAVDESLSQTEISGINASVNIEVDKEAELSIVIDKANGDFLKLKGEAQLNGGIDPSGKTTLTGRYELKEGAYEMNFNLIKRKFDIESGSYILWTGEPTSADINITAVYRNEAAPIDLVGDQLGTVSAEVRNTYKQKIPFETELKMNGELMKPTISFDIILPDGNNSVSTEIINATQAKLAQLRQQPDELNKQVFALLLLNRFIGENPFASEAGGTTVSSLARASASKILSQQLNNLAGDLISGVELNFDLNSTEDYTTGTLENRTDLNVGISKKLLNDRLKVTVGSSFGLEGPQQQNQEANNIAGDVAVEYQLSKDGRYKLRAYRLNKYQVALQGQVVETGIAFILTLDYNKFKELFQAKKTTKEAKKSK
jgi:cytoskeletal protein CcmA (bactofilin family)